jgi:hypothetical protein
VRDAEERDVARTADSHFVGTHFAGDAALV